MESLDAQVDWWACKSYRMAGSNVYDGESIIVGHTSVCALLLRGLMDDSVVHL